MRRRLVALTIVATLQLLALVAPLAVRACSCMADVTFEQHLEFSPGGPLVVGRVGRDRLDGSYDFLVDRWYGGTDRRAVITLQSARQRFADGTEAFNTCGMDFRVGQPLLFLGGSAEDGSYAPSICSLTADPTTPIGADYERLAAAALGPPVVPGQAEEPPPPAADGSDGPGVLVLALGMAGAVAALFGGVVLLGRRRRANPT